MRFETGKVDGGAAGARSAARRSGRAVAAVALVALTFAALGACSSDSNDAASTTTTTTAEQAYCDAWAGVVNAFAAYDQIDVINQGVDSVRSFVDGVETSLQTFETAAKGQFGPEVDAMKSSLQTLKDALGGSGEVRTALTGVDTAFKNLTASLTPGCPSVTVGTTTS